MKLTPEQAELSARAEAKLRPPIQGMPREARKTDVGYGVPLWQVGVEDKHAGWVGVPALNPADPGDCFKDGGLIGVAEIEVSPTYTYKKQPPWRASFWVGPIQHVYPAATPHQAFLKAWWPLAERLVK